MGAEWWAPSGFESCMMLLLQCPVYLFLWWYCGQVFSWGEGKSLPLHFLFLPSYWKGKGAAPALDWDDRIGQEMWKSQRNNSVVCYKLSKSYKSQTWLRELSLEMENRKIFCLLGQNGAGKSTTINLLTGLFPASHGHWWFRGKSIHTDM